MLENINQYLLTNDSYEFNSAVVRELVDNQKYNHA